MTTLLKQYNIRTNLFLHHTIRGILIVLSSFYSVHAQTNLVPNPGFETYSTCPTAPNQLDLATDWFNPLNADSSKPDYYNACNTTCGQCVSVPGNAMGYQPAHGGTGYAGIYLLNYPAGNSTDPYREYISCKLLHPLVCGRLYQVNYYAAAAQRGLATSSIQVLFTTYTPNGSGHNLISKLPQLDNSYFNYIKDTGAWTAVTGTYVASGGENYITIGNFNTDYNSNTIIGDTSQETHAYVYIDDVSMTAINNDSCEAPNPAAPITLPNAFTPNNDHKNDTWHLLSNTAFTAFDLKVYNRWGALVYQTKDPAFVWDGMNGSDILPQGTYVWYVSYQVLGLKGSFSQKGDVMILR